MIAERLAARHLVLMGIGHTNAHVVRMWKMNPLPDTDLTCVSDKPVATYSGMLPAVLCGQLAEPEMEIDLVRLCASVGARLIVGRVTGLDPKRQLLQFDTRPPVPFDALSIGIGSVPTMADVEVTGESLLKIKPMQTFLGRLRAAVIRTADEIKAAEIGAAAPGGRPLRVAVVGGGVAGVEILFCLPPFLREATDLPHELRMITRGDTVAGGVGDGLRRRIMREIERRGHSLTSGRAVVRVTPGEVLLDDDSVIDADLVIWATGADSPPELGMLNLPRDPRGFLATDHTLRSVSAAPVFAVGDTGTIVDQPLPKSGVYAVREGPVLWDNLQRLLDGRPLREFRPQSSFMKLLNLGDGRAVGEWKGISFGGAWTLRLKHWIDKRFMDKFEPTPMATADGEPMQCRGCGCKLGGDLLDAALDATSLAGGDSPAPRDDAAPIGDNGSLLASTDFFSNPFDDAHLAGRVTALHCASDLIASGAAVRQALANVVLPEGDPRSQQRALSDFLEGARQEFQAMGGSIVGGHTIIGPRMEAGFTVVGEVRGRMLQKQLLRSGDELLLTKPLGIGVLLAAHMRSACHADDYQAMLETMLARQHGYVELARRHDILAGTDVTGFGLAGHLLEMLDASGMTAELDLDSIPVLSGASEAVAAGIESSLAPANRHVRPRIEASEAAARSPRFALLFDPQTCGGLLLGVPTDRMASLLEDVSAAGYPLPTRIGRVLQSPADGSPTDGSLSSRKPLAIR